MVSMINMNERKQSKVKYHFFLNVHFCTNNSDVAYMYVILHSKVFYFFFAKPNTSV